MKDVQVFLAVARHQSFAGAARSLGWTRSTVSKRIARLERRLGVRLLQRTTRQVTLTPLGDQLVHRARPLFEALHRLESDIAKAQGELAGTVRIASPLSFGLREVAPSLRRLSQRHPRIRLQVDYSDQLVDVVAGRFDLAIRGAALEDSGLLARRLRPVRARLVASPDYLSRTGRPTAPADLARHRLVWVNRKPVSFRRGSTHHVFRPEDPHILSNNADDRVACAVAGLGIALIPDFAVPEDGVERVLAEWEVMGPRSFWLLQPPGRPPSRAVEAVIDHLVADLRDGIAGK